MSTLNPLEKRIVELSFQHKLTHVSSCLNVVNLLDWIYEQRGKDDPVVLDNSHAGLALYVVLEEHDLCDAEQMIEDHGTHAGRDPEHGILVSGGSLGQPATVAVGLAMADKNRKVWLVTSDGSCMEGATYEALRIADKFCLNLETFIVYNGFGAYGRIEHHELPRFSNVRIYYVDSLRYPEWLKGLPGHYLQLTKSQYAELIGLDIIPDDAHAYCQAHGLRILCGSAFQYFYNNLGDLKGNYLEIGVFEGFMLRELAKKYPDKMFYGVDPFIEDGNTRGHASTMQEKGERMPEQEGITERNIEGLQNVKLFKETSRAFGERLTDEMIQEMNIGSVFVDGDHSYEEASNDFVIAARLLKNGGVMYPDDTGLPSVGQALKEFKEREKDRLLHPEGGIITLKPL